MRETECWSKELCDCCCTCESQIKLMCHPWNESFGKGPITEQCGWVCAMEFEDGSNKGINMFFDFGHGLCEMYEPKVKQVQDSDTIES